MNALERLTACKSLLLGWEGHFDTAVKKGNQQDDPEAISIARGLRFGVRTIDAVSLLLVRRDLAHMAMILCRPFYELSVKLLWASRQPDGWKRLFASLAHNDREWAEEAVNFPNLAAHAQSVLDVAISVLSRVDARGKPFKRLPNFKQLLENVADRDRADGIVTSADGHQYEYTNVYRTLCRPAHGNLVTIGVDPGDSSLSLIVVFLVYSTNIIGRVFIHVASADEKHHLDELGNIILDLLKSCSDLRWSDILAAESKTQCVAP